MTPNEMLEEARGRFIVLYHDDPAALERLLRQALRKFQDKAGLLLALETSESAAVLPSDCRHVAVCCDSGRRFMGHSVSVETCPLDADGNPVPKPDGWTDGWTEADGCSCGCSEGSACSCVSAKAAYAAALASGNGSEETAVIRLSVLSRHVAPYRIEYFADLFHWDGDADVPGDCAALITDYLEALIAVPNSERARFTAYTTGIPAQDIPPLSELRQRIAELETEMEDSKALVPSTSWY